MKSALCSKMKRSVSTRCSGINIFRCGKLISMVQLPLPVNYFQTGDGANAIVTGRLGCFENLLGQRVEIVQLEDLDYEKNDKFWTVSIGNCKLNPTGCWSPYTARLAGGGGGVMGFYDICCGDAASHSNFYIQMGKI